jgi:hypothetical protein
MAHARFAAFSFREKKMTNLPARVFIKEEGPREGFQIERAPIPTRTRSD